MLLAVLVFVGACAFPSSAVAQRSAAPAASANPQPAVEPSIVAAPSPAGSPPPAYGAPPAGIDLFYVQVAGYPAWLIGYDWQGQPRATVHLKELDAAPNGPMAISVAPDGSGFVAGNYTFDRTGKAINEYSTGGKEGGPTAWSDDGSTLCGVTATSTITAAPTAQGSTDYYLVRRTPTTPPVRVTRFLHLDASPGDMGYGLRACVPSLDRALAVRTVCCSTAGAIAFRLSDGAVLARWERDAGEPLFSTDGQLVADPTEDAAHSTTSTTVSTILGGAVIARYGPGLKFASISRDNRYALVTTPDSGGPIAQVIEISTGRVTWRDQAPRSLNAVWSRPASGDMAIAFAPSPPPAPCTAGPISCPGPESNILIVRPDGSTTALPGRFIATVRPWGF